MTLIVQDDGYNSAHYNMQYDSTFLDNPLDRPLLRFYSWQAPSCTYGYFIDPWKFINEKQAIKYSIACAKRPTGGGLLFHEQDVSFTLFLPIGHPIVSNDTKQNYATINQAVLNALKKCFSIENDIMFAKEETHVPTLCMAQKTVFDPVLNGRKIGGAAERRTKSCLMHQSSIFLSPISQRLLDILCVDEKYQKAIREQSTAIFSEALNKAYYEEIAQEFKQILIKDLSMLII